MYTLLDGVKQNSLHPETFEIPSKEEIQQLTIGDVVKLGFEKKDDMTERMWVIITHISGDQFEGKLDNDPVIIDIKIGDKVEFKAKNIIGIYSR